MDSNYEALNCDVETMHSNESDYKLIEKYLQNTQGYHKLKMLDLFRIKRHGEAEKFNPLKLGNKKLLWHGSRFSNFVGILINGMRIAPPEAP